MLVGLGLADCCFNAVLVRALHPHHSNCLLYLPIPTIVNTRIQHMGGREVVFGGLGEED